MAEDDDSIATDEPAAPGDEAQDDSGEKWAKVRETTALVLLSVTAVLTAWCGFEASKWGGEMSISFSRASTARIEAARQQGVANNARQEDLTIYAAYVQAEAEGNKQLANYVKERFNPEFEVAYDAWIAAGNRPGRRSRCRSTCLRVPRRRRPPTSEPTRCSPRRW